MKNHHQTIDGSGGLFSSYCFIIIFSTIRKHIDKKNLQHQLILPSVGRLSNREVSEEQGFTISRTDYRIVSTCTVYEKIVLQFPNGEILCIEMFYFLLYHIIHQHRKFDPRTKNVL